MNKTFKKILSVCCTVVTTLTATLFRSTEVHANNAYDIVFIGDQKVGKTQLAKRIAAEEFDENYTSTIGLDFFNTTTTAEDLLQLWDMAGCGLYQHLAPQYYKDAHVLLYCCSAQQLKSYTQNYNIAKYNIPRGSKVLICITQTDTMTDATSETKTQIGQTLEYFRQNATGCTILPEILVTSAKNNQYKFCTPENYDSTDCKNIYQNLANDIVDLCRDSEGDQNTEENELCEKNKYAEKTETTINDRLDELDTIGNGNKRQLHLGYWLGIPTSLFGIGLLGYYGYDRHKNKKAVNHPTGKYIQHENKQIKKNIK